MEELANKLNGLISQMENITNITKVSKETGKSFIEISVWKKVEDGILDNIQNASPEQIEMLINNRKFQYYIELNKKENLKSEITKRLRNYKLNEILN